ncbi:MAG: class A beta-lactamase-related serine hydrolase [Bacteroides sp.]|nr:class A beta-lactamase-related serine hydrolase [Bacteroides sp.]
MKKIVIILYVLLWAGPVSRAGEQEKQEPFLLYRLMQADDVLSRYLQEAADLDIQILFTRICRDSSGAPMLDKHTFRLDEKEYFNPASLVKWPLILLAMERVNELRAEVPAISLDNRMEFLGHTPYMPRTTEDPLAPDRVPRLSNYIKEMLLASDDNAYNRVYDFLGQEYIHRRLAEKGYDGVRVIARFAPCSYEENRETPPVRLYENDGRLIYSQPGQVNQQLLSNPLGRVVVGGRDYSRFNRLSLEDMYEMMLGVFVPEAVPQARRFALSEADLELLQSYTAMYPGDSEFVSFRENARFYHRHLKKYLLYGRDPEATDIPGLRIHNMVGESHGTLADVAYFVNPEDGVEFVLAAVINTCGKKEITYANYRYQQIGYPFLQRLGECVYRYCRQQTCNSSLRKR